MQKGWIAILVGTMAALALAVGGTWVFTQTSQASAAEVIESVTRESNAVAVQDTIREGNVAGREGMARQSNVAARQVVAPNRGVRGDDWKPQADGFRGGPKGDHEALLAEALGISVEELQAAHEAARAAGIQQALADGVITQEQADQLLSGERNGTRGGPRGAPRGKSGSFGNIDRGALLAEALGITPEQLQAAQEEAHDAAIQQAIDEGLITQEQADLMEAHRALKDYLDREALTAQALGITPEELQAAREAGQSHRELIEELGLDRATLRENMQSAHEAAIQQAVADGVITQEQADQIQSGEGRGKFGGPRGHGSPGGKGHFRGGKGRHGGDGFRGGEGRRGGDGFRGPRENGNFNGNGAPSQNNNSTFPASDA